MNRTRGVAPRLLDEPRFRRFCLAELLSQVGDNAFNYGLLIMVVARDERTIFSTLLLVAFIVPALLIGLIGGIVVDHLPRRLVLTTVPLVKVALLMLYLLGTGDLWHLYVLAATFSACRQFYGPAVAAAVPALVTGTRLVSATAMLNLVTAAGQAIGMAILAPLILKLPGEKAFVAALALIFFAGGVRVATVPALTLPTPDYAGHRRRGIGTALSEGLRAIRADRASFRAMVQLTFTSMSILILFPLVPLFTHEVVGLDTEDSVFLFTPAVLGVVAGLRLSEYLAGWLGPARLATVAYLLFLMGITALGFVEAVVGLVADENTLNVPMLAALFDVNAAAVVTIVAVMPIGFAYAVILSSARAVLTQRSAVELRGRVFATQVTIANLVALPPLVTAGLLTDPLGVRAVLVGVATLSFAGSILAPRRFWWARPVATAAVH